MNWLIIIDYNPSTSNKLLFLESIADIPKICKTNLQSFAKSQLSTPSNLILNYLPSAMQEDLFSPSTMLPESSVNLVKIQNLFSVP